MKQNTPEWHEARRGHITASRFSDVMTSSRGSAALSKGAETYLYELIGEHLTGKPVDELSNNRACRWGHEHEPIAKDAYGLAVGRDPVDVGFVHHDSLKLVGCSPDGIAGPNGCIEVKCPMTPKEHVRTLITRQVPSQYVAQVQGVMWVTESDWCDFISFDPRVEYQHQLVVVRVMVDEEFREKLITRVTHFHTTLLATLDQLSGVISKEIAA